ncbi:MAG: hypothetical protein Q8N63_09230 [Nanoarchaeota archaeon]|nr:hypothetical protein [Nanoarchaeota archaeon]
MAEDLDKISEEEIVALAENNIPRDLLEEIASPIPEIVNHYFLKLKNETLIFCPDNQGNYYLWDNHSPFKTFN